MSEDSASDPFAPPAVSTEVCCIHCGETYDSWQIEWRVFTDSHGKEQGFWCCPMPECDGKGFGFDILPTDPNYRDERGGWCSFDDDEDEDDCDIDDEEWDEEAEALAQEADAYEDSLPSGADIPWDDPTSEPSSDGKKALGEDWPFSMN